jgi:hypothetical protein
MATDENRKYQIITALVTGHEALYHSSAIFKSKIEMMAHLIPLLVDDMAASAEHEHIEFLDRLAQERERSPMYLVTDGEGPKVICGARPEDGAEQEFCVLDPSHPGAHQAAAYVFEGHTYPGVRWAQ